MTLSLLYALPVPILDDRVQEFLAQPHPAIVATIGEGGLPSQSVVWFVPDGATVWFSTRPTSAKVRDLRRDPRLTVLVLGDGAGSYVRIEGTATLDEHVSPEARLQLISRYVGPDEAPAWIAGHPLPGPNQLVRLTPTRVVCYGVS